MIYENASSKVFPGFYDSILYDTDMLYHYENGLLPEGCEWDFTAESWEEYKVETMNAWVDSMNKNFEYNPLNVKLKYKGSWSPQYYNYETDKIHLDVDIDEDKLKEWCLTENRDHFNQYLVKTWSSYDGFISFIPNSISVFEEQVDHDSDLLEIMLEFYLLQNIDFEKVEYYVMEREWERLYDKVFIYKDGKLYMPVYQEDYYTLGEQVA